MAAWGRTRQRRLAEAEVVVVGTGRIGGVTAPGLHTAGIGRITCIDPQVIERGQLGALLFASGQDIGRPKAKVLAEFLSRRTQGKVIGIVGKVENVGFERLLTKRTLAICCANNIAARHYVERSAIAAQVPVIQVAAFDSRDKHAGMITFHFPEYPHLVCYACLHEQAKQKRSAALLTTVTGVIGQWAAYEAVMLLAGFRRDLEKAGNVVMIDLETGRVESLTLMRRPDCEVCKPSWPS